MVAIVLRLFRRREPEPPTGDPERRRAVEQVLDELRPLLRADGGDVRLLGVDDGLVRLRWQGACSHCSLSESTLRQALEPTLRARLDWIRSVDVS